jgi:radical SAM superfamily enzyme YgiQ (UPF0313 family)
MHYTGTIWRPPYEGSSLLLQATAGCTHHKCKFCSLYADLPFSFKLSPLEEMEQDLLEVQTVLHDPQLMAMARLQGVLPQKDIRRVFLTGANPFALATDRLLAIADLIHQYLPAVQTIGCFARVTDPARKTDRELQDLRQAGYDGLTIGMETADDQALAFMNKGYEAKDILQQCRRLEGAGIAYAFFYLVGVSGAGRGEEGARCTAQLCNQLHPCLIGANMLTIYPESELYLALQQGTWQEEGELEKYREIRALAEGLTIPTIFAAMGASNPYQFQAQLPQDRKQLLGMLDEIISSTPEADLRAYRTQLPHL